MVHLEIKGINVDFPFQPYKCQVDYMEKVITCLQEQKNGVLESPTGTGKTLSLLCAALAWRETFVAHAQLTQGVMKTKSETFHKDLEETLSCAAGNGAQGVKQFIPKIIYASRTHSQLSQAVNELKNTIYRPKVCVLGSRDQMCINPDVLKLDGSTAKVYACKGKITSRSCMFYNNLDSQKENKEFSDNILDIEDLNKLGDKNKVCPYFMSRELRNDADLIFMPYNYVLDFKSRQANSIDLHGTIILLDEAHNVEQICEETASFDLKSFDLASCMEDCDECIQILRENCGSIGEEDEAPSTDMTPEDAARLKMIFQKIEYMIDNIELKDGKFQEEGSYLYTLLSMENINATTVIQILDAIDKCNALLASHVSKVHRGKHFAMQKIADILKILFCRTGEPSNMNLETSRFYKVFIRSEGMSEYEKSKLDVWSSSKKSSGRTLSYWCFNPGLSMKELVRQGIRSLILTSGTLSPLDSFTSELEVPFPIQLQNPHVITNKQIWAGIITRGPDGVELNSSYHTRFTDKYLNSLGNLLANLSRTTPHGVLVFFPSYPVMDKSIEFWGKNGALGRIEQNKAYFCEPRNKKMLNGIMEQFYDKVNDPKLKGAIFFAVCRGKVSEGLDFANENGRVVVVTGLPFPPRIDPKVELKMQYLDNSKKRSALTGRNWYRQQASRAVNQAVGRVIRHNQDYGAILLCDLRFSYSEAKEQLPIWIKPHLRTYHEFGIAQRNVIQFFRLAETFVSSSTSKINKKKPINALQEKDHSDSTSNVNTATKKTNSVVKIHSRRSRPIVTQIHAPSNFNSSASNSLAILRSEEKPAVKESLFLSLRNIGDKKEDLITPTSTSTMSASIFNDKKSSDHKADDPNRTKAKKMKMVLKKQDDEQKQSSSTPNDANSELKCTKGKNTTAQQYLGSFKQCVSKDDYNKFGKIIFTYKKTHNIENFVDHLTSFFKLNIEKLHFFEGMSVFVKGEHRIIFDEAYARFKEEVKGLVRSKDTKWPDGADVKNGVNSANLRALNRADSQAAVQKTYMQGAVREACSQAEVAKTGLQDTPKNSNPQATVTKIGSQAAIMKTDSQAAVRSFQGAAARQAGNSEKSEPKFKRQKLNGSSVSIGNQDRVENNPNDFFPELSDEESNPDDADKELQEFLDPACVVCKKSAKGPHKAPCGHVACYGCWLGHLKTVKACPKCNQHTRHKKLQKMFFY